MTIPFWIPSLWIGSTLAFLPGAPWVTLMGYHLMCLAAAKGQSPFHWGRVPSLVLGFCATAAGMAFWILHKQAPGHAVLPMAGAQAFLAHWPGGLPSYAAYTLTVNSLCEEWYWRGAVPVQNPHWKDWQHGAAFSLHHVVANGMVFGLGSVPLACGYTSLGGWIAMKAARRWQGLGAVMLAHSALNALSFAWLYGFLR